MFTSPAFGKFGLASLFVAAGIISGIVINEKIRKEPKLCNCSCPEPTVSVQPFDVDKIKGLKEFNYSPQYTGNIKVEGIDSSAVHRWINHSIVTAIEKHVKNDKSKRR